MKASYLAGVAIMIVGLTAAASGVSAGSHSGNGFGEIKLTKITAGGTHSNAAVPLPNLTKARLHTRPE